MANPNDYILDLKGHPRPARTGIPETIVRDIDWFNANRASGRIFDPVGGIEGMVIHATAGSTSGGALQWWRTGADASAHWVIPGESEPIHGQTVIAAVYEARAARHVRNDRSSPRVNGGRSRINHWTLGIEIVNTQDIHDYTDPYSGWQLEMAALLTRYAWAKYPNFRWVFSHAAVDPGRRADPGRQFPWNQFVQLLLSPAEAMLPFPMLDPVPEPGEQGDAGRTPCCG